MRTDKSEIKLRPFHRLVDLFPKLTDDEFDKLVADIDRHGQRVEIDTWNGEIIDGKHRALACQKLGIEPRYRERRFESEIGARDYVVSLNFHHRHLDPKDKRTLIAAFADWSKSDRAIAAQLKTNKDTVGRVRKAVEKKGAEQKKASTVSTETVEKKRTGKDGKVRKQPAKKAAKVAAKVEPKVDPKLVEPATVEPKPVDRRQGLLDRAREAISLAQFDDLHGLPTDQEMCRIAQAAATAWLEVARILTSRKPAAEAKVETPAPKPEASCGANPFVPADDDFVSRCVTGAA